MFIRHCIGRHDPRRVLERLFPDAATWDRVLFGDYSHDLGRGQFSIGEQSTAFPLCFHCRPSSLKTMPFMTFVAAHQMFVANVERMSGTIPELLGHQELGIGTYKTMPSVSGTVPADYHPAHAAAQRPAGSPAIHMPGIGYLAIFYVPFSGTLPHTFFCNGNNSAFKHSNHAIVAGSHLSGTVPPCMFEEAERMKVVCLQHQRLSGIIPDLSGSNDMLVFRVEENNFDTLPPAFPSNLEHFMSADNPRMDYRGTHLATLLNASYDLKDFSFSSDNMVARSLEYSLMQSQHKIPEMGFSAIQPAVPLDCHIGESCAIHLTVIIGNQLLPMNSIGLNFEIRLNPNSTQLDDHILAMRDHMQQIQLQRQRHRNVSSSSDQGRRQMQEINAAVLEEEEEQFDEFQTDSVGGVGGGGGADLDFGESLSRVAALLP